MRPSSSATYRLQPLSISRSTRARRLASRKLLASSSPVDTQLSIQTRATSSYSSGRAGRTVGIGITGLPNKKGALLRAPLFKQKSGKIVAVEVHHLGPRRHEVV